MKRFSAVRYDITNLREIDKIRFNGNLREYLNMLERRKRYAKRFGIQFNVNDPYRNYGIKFYD